MAQANTLEIAPRWEYVSDRVMGGVSAGWLECEPVNGRGAARLRGRVSLENNGGFIQMAQDAAEDGGVLDVSGWSGIELDVLGNGETYELRLKTTQLSRPWQSFRTLFEARDQWQCLRLPFAGFQAYRTDAAFDPAAVRRIGIVAVGREFEADVSVARMRLYR